MSSYSPNFERNSKGNFNIDDNYISIKSGTEAYLLEDELNELQWIQYEQKALSIRSLVNSGLMSNQPIVSDKVEDKNLNDVLHVKSHGNLDMDENSMLWSIKDYVPINLNGYTFKLCGTHKKNVGGEITNNNNILINLSNLDSKDVISNELVYLEMWFEELDVSNNNLVYKFGGVGNDSFELQKDSRLNLETTRRIQLRWKIKTERNCSSMTDVLVPTINQNSGIKYRKATSVRGNSCGNDNNLFVGVVDSTIKAVSMDNVYYAIPLFMVDRRFGEIRKEDVELIFNTCQHYSSEFSSNSISFGEDDKKVMIENIDGNSVNIKNKKTNNLIGLTVDNLNCTEINCENASIDVFKIKDLTTNQSTYFSNVNQVTSLLDDNTKSVSNLVINDLNFNSINGLSAELNKIIIKDLTSNKKAYIENNDNLISIKDEANNLLVGLNVKELVTENINCGTKISSQELDSVDASLTNINNESLTSIDIQTNTIETTKGTVSEINVKDSENGKIIKVLNKNGDLQVLDSTNVNNGGYGDLTVGNLYIKGKNTIVEAETVTVADNIIVLNSDVESSEAPTEDSGIEVNRGNDIAASLLWNEDNDCWTAGLLNSEDVILLKNSPTIVNPIIENNIAIKSFRSQDSLVKIEAKNSTDEVLSSLEFSEINNVKKWKVNNGYGLSGEIATVNSNNITCDNNGNVAFAHIASDSKKPEIQSAIGRKSLFVDTEAKKLYFDNGVNQWLDIGKSADIAEVDEKFNYGDERPTGTTRLNFNGYFFPSKIQISEYNDYAEYFEKGDITVQPGDVVMCSESAENEYVKSIGEYSKLVVGVCSDSYGHILGGDGKKSDAQNYIPLGLSGRVSVKVTGNIKKGDLLVSSNINGVAMKSEKYVPGTVIGKALEDNVGKEINKIKMLIMNI